MKKVAKERAVLELPLITEPWQADNLDKRMEHARRIYNQMLEDKLKIYNEVTKTKKWREIQDIIKEELQLADSEGSKKKSDRLKVAYDEKNEILKENGFSEFAFTGAVSYYARYYAKTVSSNTAALTIATPMWSAFNKLLFGNGNAVHFKKFGQQNTLTSNNKSGIVFKQNEDGKYIVILSNRNTKAKKVEIPVNLINDEYTRNMLDANIKQCRIIRRMEKSKYHYYVQLVVDRSPYIKLNADGNPIHSIGEGKVGIAIWRNTICAVCDNKVLLRKFSLNLESFEAERDALNKELEHLRRVNNPDNYNEDGTIKKGTYDENGKRQRLTWNYSSHYKQIRNKKRELERKEKVRRTLYQNKLLNEIFAMGDTFVVMDTSFITKKPPFDPDEPNKISNEEYKKKKERRKAIQAGAPAEFLAKLDSKLKAVKAEPVNKIKIPEELYWYQHVENISDERLFEGDMLQIGKTRILHTVYRAFLIRYFDMECKLYNREACEKDWDRFLDMYVNMC